MTQRPYKAGNYKAGNQKTQGSNPDNRRARRGIDPLTMVVGLGALFVAAVGLSEDASWVSAIDPRWLLAAGAVLVGVLLLVGTLRKPRNGNNDDGS